MAEKMIGFRIYKCLHGWCVIRDDVAQVYEPVSRIRAYSSFSQALWHMGKRIKEIEGAGDAERSRGNGSSEAPSSNQKREGEQPELRSEVPVPLDA